MVIMWSYLAKVNDVPPLIITAVNSLIMLVLYAALAIVVGVLIEVPTMLMLVSICKKTCYSFEECHLDLP